MSLVVRRQSFGSGSSKAGVSLLTSLDSKIKRAWTCVSTTWTSMALNSFFFWDEALGVGPKMAAGSSVSVL